MRDCEELRNELPDFLRGRQTGLSVGMSGEDSKDALHQNRIEAHLAICASCREEATSLEKTLALIERASITSPPETYWRHFLPRLHDRLAAKEQSRSGVAPWVERFLIPSAALVATVLILIHVPLISPPSEHRLELREIVAQMSPEELWSVVSAPATLLPQPLNELGIISELGTVTTDEAATEVAEVLLDVSEEEVQQLLVASLYGSTVSGFESLTEEEAEELVRHLQSRESK